MSGSSPKPPSGLDETIAANTVSDDTLPATDSQIPVEPSLRSSRTSIPPVPTHRYRHGGELGRGGMGRVVEAYDTQLGRTVALKEVLPSTSNVARRFVREIEITARLEHHGIVPLYDSGTTPDGRPFYVMRRVTGKPLDQVIHAAKHLDARLTLLPAMLAAIDAIAHAHKRGVIHRDLKPTNILVGEHGETVVIDWGLAKVIDEPDDDTPEPLIPSAADSLQTQAGSVFGTPGFMAPEQARGEELSPSTDVYALGATLYQLLAGKPPVGGTSATEVIGKTLKHEVKPLAEVVDGVPPELIAIVDKALAFDAVVRYRNGSELADDLRRFLDGRLVAAHDYTARQRFSRFVKKHRAILGVIALALVAVAAFAWFSVSRVIEERDVATTARKQALVEKQLAEQARDRLAERNDTLVVTQARSLLESNPTHAIATLADLPPTSKRIPDARAVAQSAAARGVWWAIQGPDAFSLRLELSEDGTMLVQTTRDNVVRVWDLERKKLVIARPYSTHVDVRWVREKRVLVFTNDAPPELLDPAGNVATKLGTEPIDQASTTETGAAALVVDKAGVASMLDLATGARTPVWPGHVVTDAELAPDGSWLALADKTVVVALDQSGKQLVHYDLTEPVRLLVSPERRLGILMNGQVLETALDGTNTWVTLPVSRPGQPRMVVDAIYRGSSLEVLVADGEVLGWKQGKLIERGMQIDTITAGLRVAADGALLAASAQSRLHLHTASMKLRLTLPTTVGHMRIVARSTSSRVIVAGDGLILGVDLAEIIPRSLPFPIGTNMAFAGDAQLFTWRNVNELAWGDVALGTRIDIVTNPVATYQPASLDASSGRVILREESARGRRLLLAKRGSPDLTELLPDIAAPDPWAALVRGDGVIFGKGETKPDGRIFGRVGTAEPREIVKLDGDVTATVALAPLEFAAISTKGELVRANLSTKAVTRATIAAGSSMFVASDLDHRIAVVVDSRLYTWERDVTEVARFDKPISRVFVAADGTAIVTLSDGDTLSVPLVANAQPKRLLPPSEHESTMDADGKTIAALTTGFQIGLIDLASGARWSFPAAHAGRPVLALSPRGRYLVQDTFSGLVVWRLPAPDADLFAWISEHTSARIVDDVLTWPWQRH